IRDRLRAAGRLDGAVIGARLGLDGELIAPAEHVLTGNHPLPYLSTLIIPATRPARGSSLARGSLAPDPPAPAAAPTPARPDHHPSDIDVTFMSPGRHECDIHVAAAGAQDAAPASGAQPEGRTGRVVFVGAGPGAPDLLTERGANAIQAADVVIWASSLVDH